MLRQILLHKLLDLFRVNLRLIRYYIRSRQFVTTAIRIRDADDGGVKDLVVRKQESFELGGRDLEAFVFDELLYMVSEHGPAHDGF
jgi:hypothetical protein